MTARPAPMIDDPIYKGCANQRYGPDAVTSRALFKCPAAQIRSASPHAAIDTPMASDAGVGRASTSTRTPNRKPDATRTRASRAARRPLARMPGGEGSATAAPARESPVDRRQHFFDLDVEQAHAVLRA